MWSRVVEIMLGFWLLVSPFVFRHSTGDGALWTNDLVCGAAIIVCGLLSYWRPTRHAHAVTFAIAIWLVGFAYWDGFGQASPAAQNQLVLGLLLAMFAIVPNAATLPPHSWRGRGEARDGEQRAA